MGGNYQRKVGKSTAVRELGKQFRYFVEVNLEKQPGLRQLFAGYIKYLFFDLGVMQTMLNIPAADILMATEVDFVNKGGASEMFAGLEMMKYGDCFMKNDLHYWQNHARNSQAEVDYVKVQNGKILPIEVKASTQGSMQSLWIFMRERKLSRSLRTSLENFGHLSYCDKKDDHAERHVDIVPLYALSNLFIIHP